MVLPLQIGGMMITSNTYVFYPCIEVCSHYTTRDASTVVSLSTSHLVTNHGVCFTRAASSMVSIVTAREAVRRTAGCCFSWMASDGLVVAIGITTGSATLFITEHRAFTAGVVPVTSAVKVFPGGHGCNAPNFVVVGSVASIHRPFGYTPYHFVVLVANSFIVTLTDGSATVELLSVV